MFALMLLILLVAAAAFCGLVLFRNELVFHARERALDLVNDIELETVYRAGPDYDEMLWDFRKWTFGQFYPELAGRVTP